MADTRILRAADDRGIALILAVLTLLLLSALATGIVLLSGSESSLVGNQRAYSLAFEGGLGGLEEARSRLSASDPSFIGSGGAITFPAAVGDIYYIENNSTALTAANISSSTNNYYDWEYDQEWGSGALAAAKAAGKITVATSDAQSASLSSLLPTLPYKWVRVTILTEKAANRDINNDGTINNTTPVYYNAGTNSQNLTSTGGTVYRLTALALLPGITSSIVPMVQYDVGPGSPIPSMPGALTLCGPSVSWGPPHSNNWKFTGTDMGTPPQATVDGIATCSNSQATTIQGDLPKPANYVGKGGTAANAIVNDSGTMGSCLQTVTCLEKLVATLKAEANQVFIGPSTPSSLGTVAAPLITVVEDQHTPSFAAGDMSGCNGAGILVVTGTLTCSGGSSFYGIVLVIGQGNVQINGGGNGAFDGEVYVAQTRNASGTVLSTLGPTTFSVSGGGNNSLTFDSAYINQMQNMFAYKVLNFREISHP